MNPACTSDNSRVLCVQGFGEKGKYDRVLLLSGLLIRGGWIRYVESMIWVGSGRGQPTMSGPGAMALFIGVINIIERWPEGQIHNQWLPPLT
jgi:hypothetical protein